MSNQFWVDNFNKREKWSKYSNTKESFADMNFLLEEIGEVVAEINILNEKQFKIEELKNNKHVTIKLGEEIGDVEYALFTVACQYGVVIEFNEHFSNTKQDSVYKLIISAGELAREVRRIEIGRHGHIEPMTNQEMLNKLENKIIDCFIHLGEVANGYALTLEESFDIHKNKLISEYGE
jgi:NTP pyrophosphatase (non-canonical NTP hydrolase)